MKSFKRAFMINQIILDEQWFYTRLKYELEIFLIDHGKSTRSLNTIISNYKEKSNFSEVINGYEFTKQTIYI